MASLSKALAVAIVGVIGLSIGVLAVTFNPWRGQPPEEKRWANGSFTIGNHDDPTYEAVMSGMKAQRPVADAAVYRTEYDAPNVAVYSVAATKPAPSPFTLQDLSDAGQARAIDFVSRDPTKADSAWLQLTKTLTGPAGDIEHKDPYRADRVLVATVTKGLNESPGDRLLWTRILVKPINFEFAGYRVASTDNRIVKIAAVEDTHTAKMSIGGGIDDLVPGIAKPKLDQNLEQSRKLSAEINQQYESLGIDIHPNSLRIIRESAPGGDVAGNVSVELSAITSPTIFKRTSPWDTTDQPVEEHLKLLVANAHLTDGIKYLPPSEAKITVLPQNVLQHCPLVAAVWMFYEERKIVSGGEHYTEGLQQVEVRRGAEEGHEVEFVRADDISPAVWSIQRHDRDGTRSSTLQARTNESYPRDLVFTDYVTASELTHWLKANMDNPRLSDLTFEVSPDDVLVPTKMTRNECKQGDGSQVSTPRTP